MLTAVARSSNEVGADSSAQLQTPAMDEQNMGPMTVAAASSDDVIEHDVTSSSSLRHS